MFCSSDALQIPPSVDIWQSAACNSIVKERHMYDKISVTPGEYGSFIEFCDKGHSANKHGSKTVIAVVVVGLKPGSITPQMPRPRHKNKSIIKVEQSTFTLITLF